MFINPKVAIEQGWIKGIKDPTKQVQPNAIDFTVDRMFSLETHGHSYVGEKHKKMREPSEIHTFIGLWQDEVVGLHEHNVKYINTPPIWSLDGGRVYDGVSDMYVEVPEGVAAILYTRSTFARNGVFIMSGLYDSGFKGNIGFTIYTIGGSVNIEKGVRIGQIAFVHSENAGVYAGGYNHEQGTHYTDQQPTASKDEFIDRYKSEKSGAPTALEQPIGHNPNKTEGAQKLEDTHKWNSQQGGKPAGTKDFV